MFLNNYRVFAYLLCFTGCLFFVTNQNVSAQGQKEPEFNCEHEPCKNPTVNFLNFSFPMPGPCPDCDFNVWVKYEECPGPPLKINLEIMGAGTTDSLGDPNICATCDWKLLHIHMVNRVLFLLAGIYPNNTTIIYKSATCWVFLGKGAGTVSGWPPNFPNDPNHPLSSAPCPGQCCEYEYLTHNENDEVSVILIDKSLPDEVECLTQEQEPLLPRDCEPICDPFGYIEQKIKFNDEIMLAIQTYPNPTDNVINLNIFNLKKDVYEYQVFDINGTKKLDGIIDHFSNDIIKIDVSKLDKGIYSIKISNKIKIFKTVSFIINR